MSETDRIRGKEVSKKKQVMASDRPDHTRQIIKHRAEISQSILVVPKDEARKITTTAIHNVDSPSNGL